MKGELKNINSVTYPVLSFLLLQTVAGVGEINGKTKSRLEA